MYGSDFGFGLNKKILSYKIPVGASNKFYSGPTNTATIGNDGSITATSFSGSGRLITGINYNNITVNSLSFTTP